MDYDISRRIEETWNEIGCKARPLRDMVFVRTELLPEYVGSIYIPSSLRGNYKGLPHTCFFDAIVLAAGPKCKHVKRGDRVAFARTFFSRGWYMDDGTLTGYLPEDNVYCQIGDDVEGPKYR